MNQVKKLSLNRETLEKITDSEMHNLNGGASWTQCSQVSCPCSSWIACAGIAAAVIAIGVVIVTTDGASALALAL